MEIKHKDLELIRRNPNYIKSINSNIKQQGGKSMLRYWQYAIGRFHRNKNDSKIAIDYLEERLSEFRNTVANRNKSMELIKKLEIYFAKYNQLHFNIYKTLTKIKYDLGNGNFITGEIFRIDKKDENYFITLFYKEEEIWANELRFPLIQIYFGNILRWPVDQIYVGVFNYNKLEHEYVSFDESTLENSLEEVKNIFRKISINNK